MIPEDFGPGLYVHVPFCSRICPYCDFAVTRAGRDREGRFRRFDNALLEEFRLRPETGADTLYFGGGTPSLAPPALLGEWIAAARERGHLAPGAFVTLEANPEDLVRNPGLAREWVRAGVSGVSLGAQALDDGRLRFLGRGHRSEDVRSAVSRLAEAGMAWISLDILYGTRGQTARELASELREAAALPGVSHVSAYELTIEPGTPFAHRASGGERLTAGEPGEGGLFRVVHETLEAEGFAAYEVSNFARSEKDRSRHNQKYWSSAPYTGVGPSAHSFAPKAGVRSWNHREEGSWRRALARCELPVAGQESLGLRERALEEVLLSLRTVSGLDLSGFAGRYGERAVSANRGRFARWEERGFVHLLPDRLRPTRSGLAVADLLAREFRLEEVRP